MNKFLKFGLLGLVGLMLFFGAFVGVAAMSGAQMHEVAVIGGLFSAPDEGEQVATGTSTPELQQDDPGTRGAAALERQAGLLGAFMLESPYTGTELRKLTDEMQGTFKENREIAEALRARELEIDEWERTVNTKYKELEDFRTQLEALEGSLELQRAELDRDKAAKQSRERAGWKAQAALYAGGEPEANAAMLAGESPEDAAIILSELNTEVAGEILRLVQPLSLRKQFMDAYRKANETP